LVLLVCALIDVGHDPFRLFIGYVIGGAGTFAERLVEVLLGIKPDGRPLVQLARPLSTVAKILIPARRRPRRSTRPAPNQPAVVGGGLTGDPLWMPGLNRGGPGAGRARVAGPSRAPGALIRPTRSGAGTGSAGGQRA
jgi:hypothetical protein